MKTQAFGGGEQLNEDCFGDTTGFVFLSVCQMTLGVFFFIFFSIFLAVEFRMLGSRVFEHINEEQDLKKCVC
jgi:hypothetical protein